MEQWSHVLMDNSSIHVRSRRFRYHVVLPRIWRSPLRCPISSVRVSVIPSVLQLKGAFRCGREDCGRFVEVLVVGGVEGGLAERPCGEACAEDAVAPGAASTAQWCLFSVGPSAAISIFDKTQYAASISNKPL